MPGFSFLEHMLDIPGRHGRGTSLADPIYIDEPDPAYALEADDDEPAQAEEPVKPMRPVHRWLVRALILFMAGQAVNMAFAASDYVAYYGVIDAESFPPSDMMLLLNTASPIVQAVYYATTAIAGVAYLWFIYRAVANVRKFSPRYLPDSPGGSVVWHFVPGLSLIKPYRIMRVVWIRSHNGPRDDGDGPPLGAAWWTCWLILTFAGAFTSFSWNIQPATNANAAGLANLLDIVNIIGSLAGIASALLLMPIIRSVAEAQDFTEVAKVFEDDDGRIAAT
jgi:hypothetical protein